MGKLIEKLRAKHAEKDGRNRHRISFLAHKVDIAEAIREGWSARQIWQQLLEDGQVAMCYSNFCALVRKNIPDEDKTANAKAVPATPPAISEKPPVKPANQKMSDAELASLPEDERLEMLKNETFAKVRAPKPHGPLIVKPKTREQELQELFGPKVKSDTPPS